jgi:hypothetical protein
MDSSVDAAGDLTDARREGPAAKIAAARTLVDEAGPATERSGAEQAIHILSAARRYAPRKNPTPSERLIRRWEGIAFLGACWSLGPAILLVAFPSVTHESMVPEIRELAMVMVCLSATCAFAYLVLEPFLVVIGAGRKMDDPAHHSVGSYRHELGIVDALAGCGTDALESVDHWLATRVAGIEGRVGVLFGEKISAVALVAVLATFGRSLMDAQSSGAGHGSVWLSGCIIAVATGAVAAAIGLRMASGSFAYQKQLLAEAARIAARADAQRASTASGHLCI